MQLKYDYKVIFSSLIYAQSLHSQEIVCRIAYFGA